MPWSLGLATKWLCKWVRSLMGGLAGQPCGICAPWRRASPRAPSETPSRSQSWRLGGGGMIGVFQTSHAWVSRPAGAGEGG